MEREKDKVIDYSKYMRSGAKPKTRRRWDIPEPTTQRKSTAIISKIQRFFKRQARIARRHPKEYAIRTVVIALLLATAAAVILLIGNFIRSQAHDRDVEEDIAPTYAEHVVTPTEAIQTITQAPTPTEAAEPTKPVEPPLLQSLDWDAEESYIMARMAMAEAEDQDTETKALVILVILNRVWSPKFPGTIEDVIYQKNAFTPISNGRYDRVEPDADCWAALDLVMSGWNESQNALYFETTTDAPTWHNRHLRKLFTSGDLTFYTEKGE